MEDTSEDDAVFFNDLHQFNPDTKRWYENRLKGHELTLTLPLILPLPLPLLLTLTPIRLKGQERLPAQEYMALGPPCRSHAQVASLVECILATF